MYARFPIDAAALPPRYKRGDVLRDRKNRIRRYSAWPRVPLPLLILSSFVVLGVFCGYAFACGISARTGDELRRYFEAYLSFGTQDTYRLRVLGETVLCYFRAPLAVFLLGFASVGAFFIPLVCAFQSFLLSFALMCFSLSLGRESFPLLLVLFGIRFAVVLPCTLLLGASALGKARALLLLSFGGGTRTKGVSYSGDYWYRFGVVCICLLLGALLELWLAPQFLLLAAG